LKSELSLPHLDYEETTKKIYQFIKRIVTEANAAGVVIGLSGGVDSSLVAVLCVNALGNEKVLGVMMPASFTPKNDIEDAKQIAGTLGIQVLDVNIQTICDQFFKDLGVAETEMKHKLPRANIYARVRMIILYYYANLRNYLVVGTSDRSEALIGFFTKNGDGGADFFPIRHLYKTQVRELAQFVGLSTKVALKPSSPQLYPGHQATDEIPLNYDDLDRVLFGLFEQKLTPQEISSLIGRPIETIEEIMQRFNATKHKRKAPPTIQKG